MMRSLRVRLILSFVVIGVAPPILIGYFSQRTFVEREEARMEETLAARSDGVRAVLARRAEIDAHAVRRLCVDDLGVDAFLIDISAGHDGAESEARLARILPPIMRSLDFDSLVLLDQRGARIRASAHNPALVGSRDPQLLEAARTSEGRHFIGRSEEDEPRIYRACSVRRAGAGITLVLGRTLRAHLGEDRLGQVGATVLELSTEPQSDSELIARFEDADGARAIDLIGYLDREVLAEDIRLVRSGTASVALTAALVALLVGLVIAMRIGRALSALEEASRRVASGDLEATIGGGNEDGEIGRALIAFNRMTHELRGAHLKLRRAERIAAWRDVARRIAHEIKNPLLPLQLSIETLRKTRKREHPDFDEIFWESTETMLEEVTRLSRIVSEFSRFARMPPPSPDRLDLSRLVERTVAPYDDPRIELRLTEPLELLGDREQLTQLITNLIQNALAEAKQKIRITTRLDELDATLIVEDDGKGIPDEERDAVFEPYYTKKDDGTGLGLAIVERIVSDHGGNIEVETSQLGGACFKIRFPLSGPPPEAAATIG